MSISTMSLSTLPDVVLDNVLSYLKQGELYNISLVCKSLYEPTKKYLYRNLDGYEKHCSLVTHNLAFNPSLAFYLRTFTSYDPILLAYLCTLAPLNLQRLILKWDPGDDMYDYRHFINALDPQSRVEYLICTLHTYHEKYLMEHLHCFNGLTCVELIIPPFDWDARIFSTPDYTLQEIFDSLNCPTLESVYIENVEWEWDTLQTLNTEDRLPNLRGLRLRNVEVDDEMGTPCEIMWNTLSSLLSKSIFFKIEGSETYTSFYTLVLSYASQCGLDPVPLIQWLAKSDHFFGYHGKVDKFHLALQELTETELIQALEAIQHVDFNNAEMGFSLFDLPQPLTTSATSLFYENIVELYIHLVEGIHLDPGVIQHCIANLPRLEDLCIGLFYTENFTPANSCTTATYYFRPNRSMREDPPSMELEVFRGKRPTWRIFDYETPENPIRYCRPGTARGVMALEEEVSQWFQWSTSLRVVVLGFELSGESDVQD